MQVFATDRVTEPLGTVTEPCLAMVAQGAKRSVLGERIFDYRAGQYLVVTLDLPLTSQITRADAAEPALFFGLRLKPAVIAQLLLDAGAAPGTGRGDTGAAIGTSDADDDLIDAAVRRLRLVGNPVDQRVLAPAIEREIHWRLLTGPQAAIVRQIGLADSRHSLVARAIRWLQAHYAEVIRIDDLAADVGLSISSLNRHFRAVTAMSPLQYQKQLRLQKARIQLIADPHDIAAIGHAVGYDSPSQFSREYKRMFGAPPAQDAARLQGVCVSI
ncbi:AraC family transcriptional regulator (plasmid) [Streptomyces sp. FXJ1.172]|uniref:Helix-turn-helix domain-containing protein n=2 Tax=Streptomyces broussonetiae TaxID=2686304 RepID=A0A6I6NDD5_9ACTN|nr:MULTISPECIES: AraC family transcriptional regulator [Streptomyces]QHA09382.1 helix-turn-helix domain-containing protein [Streptomyces broussonetiae]WEP00957.1 AraC family transcriptional regulator [Streptomyces sp. FXJ1.172]